MSRLGEQIFDSSFLKDGDDYRFLDPITGDVLSPLEPPPGLLLDPRLSRGYDFLRQQAGRVRIGLALAPHGVASDLDDVDLKSRPILLLEGLHWSRDVEYDLNVASQTSLDTGAIPVSQQTAYNLHMDEWFKARLLLIRGSGVNVRFADVPRYEDTGLEIDRLMDEWDGIWMEKYDKRNVSTHAVFESTLASIGCNNYREWYMSGMIGYRLSELFDAGVKSDATFLVGSNHLHVRSKLEAMSSEVVILNHGTERLGADRLLVRALGTLSLTTKQLREFDDS